MGTPIDLDALAMIGSAKGGKRPPKAIQLLVMRELDGDDLPLILNPPEVGSVTPPLTRLRETHHHIARLLAEGRKDVEVSAITGFVQSRISILKRDPSFQELVAYYKAQTEASYTGVHERLARVGTVALQEVEDRLLDKPDSFTHKELLQVVETTLDRSVAPPKTRAAEGPSGAPAGGINIQVNFVPHQPPAGELPEGRTETDPLLIEGEK